MTITSLAQFDREAKKAAAYLMRPLRLKEIRLPAGDVGSINIGWPSNGGQRIDPDPAYDGLRIIGTDTTTIRCTAWDGVTVGVGRHDGVVQLENVTIAAGRRCAVQMGGSGGSVRPKFALRILDSTVYMPPPSALGGVRGMWGIFGYHYDEWLRNVILDTIEAMEHSRYRHGAAKMGDIWQNVRVIGSAGENKKDRPDTSETVYVPDTWSISHRCNFGNWGQPHGNWQQGGGIVQQGAKSHVLVDECVFKGRIGHSKCVMVSSEGNENPGAPGFVLVRNSLLSGAADGFWNNTLVNVYNNGGGSPALGTRIEGCAVYGQNTSVTATGQFQVVGCNTPAIRNLASAYCDTQHETVIPTAQRLVPVSEGIIR